MSLPAPHRVSADEAGGRRPRWTKGLPTVVVALAVTILIASQWAWQGREARDEWRILLSAMADEQKAAVEALVRQRRYDAEVFASFPSVREAVREAGHGAHSEGDHLQEVLERGREGWGCRSIAVLGRDLGEQIRVGEALPSGIASVLESGTGTTRVAFVGAAQRRTLVTAAPIRADRPAGPDGWVVLVDDPAPVLWKILSREPAASQTGESVLVGRDDGRFVFLSPLRHLAEGKRPALPMSGADGNASSPALSGSPAFGELRDYRDEPVFAALRRIEGPGWGLVVKIDRSEALHGLRSERAWSGLALVSLGIAAIAGLRSLRAAERLRANAEASKRDERHRHVLAHVRDAVIWVEPDDGRILEANQAAEDLWGYPRAELLSLTVFDLRPEGGRDPRTPSGEAVRESRAQFRTRHRRKDGSTVPVEVSSRMLDLDGEEVLVAIARDVSESEAALERIRLLNRLLRTISVVDQVLVEERDRETVLRRTCEEIVATGGFAVAWFGVPSEGKLVPAASAGRTSGFFDETDLFLDAPAGSRAPTVTAWVEGRTVVVNDWETDPRMEPWRKVGLRRGFRSSAACPVRCGEEIPGVLVLYADEAGAFVTDAVLLLEELARDLGLALELVATEERRFRAEASLAASEERYRKLFEENPAAMWVFDVETLRFLAVNEATVSLYGYSRDELLGRTLRDIRPAQDVAALEADVLVPRTDIRKSGPWRHLRKDGSERFVEVVTYDISFEGRPARLVLASDVTERLKAEEKLRAFFDSGMVGAIIGDVHGNVLSANDEFLRIVGSSREEVDSGRLRWADITPPEWLPVDAERIAEAKERGVCTPYEKEYVRSDGTRVPVLVGYALVGERREESVAFILDLTARKEAAARLSATTRLLRAIFEGSPAPIFTLDPDGTVTSWNRAAETVFGWPADEALGQPLPIVPPEAAGEFRSIVAEVLGGRAISGREVRRRRRDGSAVDISIAAAPLTDESGTATGLVAVVADVSARRRAEEEVRRLNSELEARVEQRTAELVAKTKELESFAYSISHDLRAPLRAIDGFSRMIEEDHAESLDGEGRRLLSIVRENARRMGQLIDDLLSFSRAGRHDLARRRVDVGSLVRSVLEEVVPDGERARTEVRLGDLPPVLADPALLRQVFVNLLSNAMKFTATRPRRQIEVAGRREHGRVVYDVVDNGVGFDMRYSQKLFGVFQRLHGREFEGTGVGLALAERIVARHGGTIQAFAEMDRGARFSVTLPAEEEST